MLFPIRLLICIVPDMFHRIYCVNSSTARVSKKKKTSNNSPENAHIISVVMERNFINNSTYVCD